MLHINKLFGCAIETRRPSSGNIRNFRVNSAAQVEYTALYDPSKPEARVERRSVLHKSDILLQQGQKVLIPK